MEFRSELTNAVKLFLLLCTLFWSFTWNSSIYFELSPAYSRDDGIQKTSDDVQSDVTERTNEETISIESFSVVRYESGHPVESSQSAAMIIPPFNEWKKKEMTKYEKVPPKSAESHLQKKPGRRKLNYASAKCGAKVLASNREARYKEAVLSQKSDEYMLNPCNAKTWFVVELCDTVEAIQFELANYELYSSYPREFSVFWSDVYPTMEWHLLGTFEAENQRTMQTFDLSEKNLGKFIKVIIYNHHGKEHYCPLSVIRVLGYSMVQKFEDIENSGNGVNHDIESDTKFTKNVTFHTKYLPPKNTTTVTDSSSTMCVFFSKHCIGTSKWSTGKVCANEPMCRFLKEVMLKSGTSCQEIFCSVVAKNITKTHRGTCEQKVKVQEDLSNKSHSNEDTKVKSKESSCYRDILSNYGNEKYAKIQKRDSDFSSGEPSNIRVKNSLANEQKLPSSAKNYTGEENINDTEHFNELVEGLLRHQETQSDKCSCDQQLKDPKAKFTLVKESSSQTSPGADDAVESAGLIHTDSVVFKLTARLKATETDLNFINKYLQELSQSYRKQMADMKVMFNQTLKTISIQSEKAKSIDNKQDESINVLETKTKALSLKVDFLLSGQRDMFKRVIELHGFFLILEIIIISTIFTIFLNIFQYKNGSMASKRMKIYNF